MRDFFIPASAGTVAEIWSLQVHPSENGSLADCCRETSTRGGQVATPNHNKKEKITKK